MHAKLANDIYVGPVSPHKAKITESEKRAEDMIYFNGKGADMILLGDFNARTSNDTDFVESDKFNTGGYFTVLSHNSGINHLFTFQSWYYYVWLLKEYLVFRIVNTLWTMIIRCALLHWVSNIITYLFLPVIFLLFIPFTSVIIDSITSATSNETLQMG